MKSALSKPAGRPSKPYRTTWGVTIDGLRHDKKSGRWFVIGTNKSFRETDERRAVARFKSMMAEQQEQTVKLKAKQVHPGNAFSAVMVGEDGSPAYMKSMMPADIDEASMWAWMREQLIARPEKCAEMTGIGELSRLADLPQREPSPTLQSCLDLYMEKSTTSDKQKKQVKGFFEKFQRFIKKRGATTLKGITPQLCAEYADMMLSTDYSPKFIGKHFSSPKTPINFAKKRGISPDECRKAVANMAVMQAPKSKSKDPKPISVENFHALLDATESDRDRALMLVMTNCAMYGSEALALNWGEIDMTTGHLSTTRSKTKNARVAVLWKRTLTALKKIRPKDTDDEAPVFLSVRKGRLTHWGWNDRFRKIRERAGVSNKVTADQYRDGAQTAAMDAGIDIDKIIVLAGHDLPGTSDFYIRRSSATVKKCCKAIEKHYFGRSTSKKTAAKTSA